MNLQDNGHIRSHHWLFENATKENVYFTAIKLSFKHRKASSHYGDQKYQWTEKLLVIWKKQLHELLNYTSSTNSYAGDYQIFKKSSEEIPVSIHLFFIPRHLLLVRERDNHQTSHQARWTFDLIYYDSTQSNQNKNIAHSNKKLFYKVQIHVTSE